VCRSLSPCSVVLSLLVIAAPAPHAHTHMRCCSHGQLCLQFVLADARHTVFCVVVCLFVCFLYTHPPSVCDRACYLLSLCCGAVRS
jgi:hypothetical protein